MIPQLDIVEQFFEDRERGNIRDTYFSLWKKRSGGGHITNVDLGWGRALLEGKMTHLISYGGEGGHKVPALISKIRIFETNTTTATKFGDFS